MKPTCDDSKHSHIGYYEDDYDIEAISYKRVGEDVWDVYFNFVFYGVERIPLEKEIYMDDYAGYYVFSIYQENPSWEEECAAFETWLREHCILERVKRK